MIVNLLDIDNFKGRYVLPIYPETENQFNELIAEIQKRVLIDLMGFPIYNEFDAGLQILPTEQKWLNLRDGVNYTNCNGNLTEWQGLDYMLIPFVWVAYVEYLRNNVTAFSVVKQNTKNSERISDLGFRQELHRMDNEGITRYYEAFKFMKANITDYNDFTTFFKTKRKSGVITKGHIL